MVVKCLTRRRYANKETKETTNGFTKSYYEETKEKKESEKIIWLMDIVWNLKRKKRKRKRIERSKWLK